MPDAFNLDEALQETRLYEEAVRKQLTDPEEIPKEEAPWPTDDDAPPGAAVKSTKTHARTRVHHDSVKKEARRQEE
ncbi:MAG TPA: hypothetical protein VKJ47_21710, partial [Candidatus Binatia bacterium]|nr:hypothetical protein [Candidatus Binatia bacterium]